MSAQRPILQLSLGFGAIMLLLIAVAMTAVVRVNLLQDELTDLVETHNLKIEIVNAMRAVVRDRMLAMNKMALQEDPFARDETAMAYDALAIRFLGLRNQLELLPQDQEELEALKMLRALTTVVTPLNNQIVELLREGRIGAARNVLLTEALAAQEAVLMQVDYILLHLKSDAQEREAAARADNARTRFLMIGLVLLALGVSILIAILVLTRARRERVILLAEFEDMRKGVHSRQRRLETILDNAAEGIITFDRAGQIRSFNRAAERLFAYPEAEIVGKDLSFLIPPTDIPDRRDGYLEHFMRSEIQRLLGHEGEVIGRQRDGTRFPLALKVSEIVLEDEPLYTALVADISERKALMEHLKNMAEHDGLTGLYNRTYFQQELDRVVERACRARESSALLYIDLDNFKYVNDTLGHAAGDKLLVEVAGLLSHRARKGDLIVRLGGDEFTVLLYGVHADQVGAIAESFRQTLADYSFKHAGERVDIGCSIGVANIAPEVESASQVLSQADVACHLAKRGGRNRIHVFAAADESSVTGMSLDMGWSRRIREAIEHNRFVLACQPIVDARNGEIESFEILIRMLDDDNGMILPGGFLPSAERFGLSVDIDRWVIVNAIETLAEQRRTTPKLRYCLNLSGQTLTQPSVCDLILDRLKITGLDPAAITFEVTETVAIADMAVAETFLRRLQEIGCRTALDDFGSGMSSFAYLRDLPVDCVKIDGRFVKNIAANPIDQVMVKAMNEIAHALGKRTVAEFVENEDSLTLLKSFGVDYAQGYHLGRPDLILPCKAIVDHAGSGVACMVPQIRSARN
jgi:diguanylate cyclase (GGDEF)-like protein/PAS domain S-box-containing protein